MKKGLAIGIVALFIVTSITPVVFGYNQALDVERDEIDATLANLHYLCITPEGFDQDRYEHYKDMYLRSIESQDDIVDVDVYEPVTIESEFAKPDYTLPLPLSLGPMNSSWPMKCHDQHHTGRSPYETECIEYVEKWYYHFDSLSDNSPVIDSNGIIYVGGCTEEYKYYLFAFYPNGTEKWKFKANGLIKNTCSAIAEDGTIYFVSWDEYLYAINPNGTLKWRFHTGDNIVSSPALATDGTIYFGTMWGTGDGGEVFAINSNGTEKWHYQTGYHITSDPAIGDDGTIYIGSGDRNLYAFHPDGTLKWTYETGDLIKGPPSIADDGTIYIGSWDYNLHAVYPDGTQRWKTEILHGSVTNPSIGKDGTIYISSGNILYAIEPYNGNVLWSLNLGGSSRYSSSAICADNIIYTGIEIGEMDGGELVAVNPDGTIRWRQLLSKTWVDSSPAIGEDGTIYVCSTSDDWGCLHAIGQLSPDAPSAPTISGILEGIPGESYDYTFNSVDPNNDDVFYQIYWGDGEGIGWFGPWESGEDVTVEYIYGWEDTFTIRARAKDVNELLGPWSELEITMPVNQQSHNSYHQFPLIQKLLELFPNTFPLLRFLLLK